MKNKTKMTLIISALSLCMLSLGASAVVAKADDTTPEFAVTFAGASVRINETEKEDGIRFAVRMSKEVWDTYNSNIEETYVKISNGTVWGAPIDTTGTWYPVDEKGKYAETDFVGYQAMVCLYGDFDATMSFTVQSFTKFVGEDDVVSSAVSPERSFSYVAKKAVEEDASLLEYLQDYIYYDVALELDGETTVQSIKYGETVTDVTLPGYVVDWKKDGEAFDVATPVTEDMTLVGEKALKPILPSASSYMQSSGTVAAADKVNVQYNVEKAGETAAILMSYSPNAWVEVYAQWKFDITQEDIQAWKTAGYNAISFKIFAQTPTATVSVKAYGMSAAESFTNATWKTVNVSLDVLESAYKNTFWVSLGAYSYGFVAGITQPELKATATITYQVGGVVVGTEEVNKGGVPSNVPEAGTGFVYNWTLNGEAYDITSPVEENITLVTAKVAKAINLADSSYFQYSNGKNVTDGKTYNVQLAGETAMVQHNGNPGAWVETYAQWKFDSTAEEIQAWIDAGYTKISFKVYAKTLGGTPQLRLYGTTKNITNQGWTDAELDLVTWKEKCGGTFQIYLGAYSYGFIAAITQPVLS